MSIIRIDTMSRGEEDAVISCFISSRVACKYFEGHTDVWTFSLFTLSLSK
jgi:hypothetical protein